MLRGRIYIDGSIVCDEKPALRNVARGFCVKTRAGAIREQHEDDKLCAFHTAARQEFDASPGDLQSALRSESPRGSTRRTLGVARQTAIERRDGVLLPHALRCECSLRAVLSSNQSCLLLFPCLDAGAWR